MNFEEWFKNRHQKTGLYEKCLSGDDDATYLKHEMRKSWEISAKQQEIPEGFVLVPKEMDWHKADKIASEHWNKYQRSHEIQNQGQNATTTSIELARLAWCKNKANQVMNNYKVMIESQQSNKE